MHQGIEQHVAGGPVEGSDDSGQGTEHYCGQRHHDGHHRSAHHDVVRPIVAGQQLAGEPGVDGLAVGPLDTGSKTVTQGGHQSSSVTPMHRRLGRKPLACSLQPTASESARPFPLVVSVLGAAMSCLRHAFGYLAAAVSLAIASVACAAPVTYNFSGALSYIAPDLASEFALGQIFSGSFTYESSTPDSNPASTQGGYDNAILHFSVSLGSATWTTTAGPSIIGIQDLDSPDAIVLIAYDATGPSVAGFSAHNLFMQFVTHLDPAAVQGDGLPTSIPPLTAFTGKDFQLSFTGCPQVGCAVAGGLTSLTLIAVPEPGTLALVLLGAVPALLVRRRLR
jgi:hypothetical protein